MNEVIDYGVAKVRPATPADADSLAPRLRQADLNEIAAATDESPVAVLRRGVEESGVCFAIVSPSDPSEVWGLFGSTPLPASPLVGSVWLLGSDQLTRIAYRFLRQSKPWLDRLFGDRKLLCNVVDARNTVHVRWLRWLGFRFVSRRENFGRNGEAFIEFCKIKETP